MGGAYEAVATHCAVLHLVDALVGDRLRGIEAAAYGHKKSEPEARLDSSIHNGIILIVNRSQI